MLTADCAGQALISPPFLVSRLSRLSRRASLMALSAYWPCFNPGAIRSDLLIVSGLSNRAYVGIALLSVAGTRAAALRLRMVRVLDLRVEPPVSVREKIRCRSSAARRVVDVLVEISSHSELLSDSLISSSVAPHHPALRRGYRRTFRTMQTVKSGHFLGKAAHDHCRGGVFFSPCLRIRSTSSSSSIGAEGFRRAWP